MAPVKHALLGASKAHQWLACPPSARDEEKYEEPAQSEAAAEGTVAHALAEDHLQKMLAGKKPSTGKKFREDPLYKPAMEEHIGVYCDTILATLAEMKKDGCDPVVFVEQQLDLSYWIPEGFGTADCVLIGNGTLHVFDLKYGKGVPVHAEENPQLKLYGLGALEEFSLLYSIDTVVLHIIQPRLESITEWPVNAEELRKWGETVVAPIAQTAFKGEGEYNPGEDQCRWCLCKNRCRAYNNYMLEKGKLQFDDQGLERNPNELSDAEIAELLNVVEEIKRWAGSVADYALDQAVNHGKTFPGYKLVEGVSRRTITNEARVITLLDDKGYTTDKTCRLRGITDLEELVGKKELQALIGDYIVKPPGKPKLAPESDNRKPINSTPFTEIKE